MADRPLIEGEDDIMVRDDGGLDGNWLYVCWRPGEHEIMIDGPLSANTLRKIADHMEAINTTQPGVKRVFGFNVKEATGKEMEEAVKFGHALAAVDHFDAEDKLYMFEHKGNLYFVTRKQMQDKMLGTSKRG